jgi:hypothetical protein
LFPLISVVEEKLCWRKLCNEGLHNLHSSPNIIRGRDSIVGTATGYGLDDGGVGVRVPVGSTIFSSPDRPDWL